MIRLKTAQMRRKGFTLIELLVVLFVISSIFFFGYANYRQYSQRQILLSLGRQIEGDLILARNYANSGKKPDSCSSLDGYKFDWNSGDATYSIYAVCGGSQIGDAVISHTIDANYELTTTCGNFMFKTLGNGTNLSSDCTITLRQNELDREIYIKVSKSGAIVLTESTP